MPVTLAQVPDYSQMTYARPSLEQIEVRHRERMKAWREAATAARQAGLVADWNAERKALETTASLAHLRYEMDTRDAAAKAEKEFFDDAGPKFSEWGLEFLKELVATPHRAALEREFGSHAFRIWDISVRSFDPVIADDRRAEAKLCNRYNELLASLKVTFQGKEMNLSLLGGFYGDADRSVRLSAQQTRQAALAPHAETLDGIFHELVQLRQQMAKKMGHSSYTSLSYVLRQRDYSPEQVAAYRKQVREVLVPLASRIRARHAQALGVSDYAYHDTFVRDMKGVPRPQGDHDWMLERATQMFSALGGDFADFWGIMRTRHLLDLKSRDGKAGGGFCTDLSSYGVPFIFANFNGTEDDVNVFTHECGHAFQAWRSLDHALVDYVVPTFDAAEIHSMSLEMLCHPHVDLFFEGDAARYRAGHLEKAILFIPYGTAIDEFQHRIYDNPGMTAEQRNREWQDLERTYLPERAYPDMPYAASGRLWQTQRHVYLSPFYYIDYCLAQTCALQFWQLAERDRGAAMTAYRRICDIGGSQPFSGIVAAAGLKSPFATGTIAELGSNLEKVVLG